jgi:hypothetical protein
MKRRTHNSTEKIRIEGKTRENDRIIGIWQDGIDAGENL